MHSIAVRKDHRSRLVGGLVATGLLLGLLLAWTAQGASAQMTSGDKIYGLTGSDRLISFNKMAPERILSDVPIGGLEPDETIVGMDFRPANGRLYAVGSTSQVYAVMLRTGMARPVGGPFTPALDGTSFGVDFNPTVDRIRLVSDADQNLRLDPNTGATAATDIALQYGATDPNAGTDPNVVGAAYTNNMAGATTTTLYDIDSGLNALVRQDPPNNGTLVTEGPLGVNTTGQVGFDIAPGYGALAAMRPEGMKSRLYKINVTTGDATKIGPIGSGRNIKDIAIPLPMP